MRLFALLMLQLALLEVSALSHDKDETIVVSKCCGIFQMLSADGKTCIDAAWPRNISLPNYDNYSVYPPLDDEWVKLWLPPGIPLRSISNVEYMSIINEEFKSLGIAIDYFSTIVRVNTSSVWDEQNPPKENIWKNQIVFHPRLFSIIVRPRPGGGFRESALNCVDAALPPLGPFVLLFSTSCTENECASKCCSESQMIVKKEGIWKCESSDKLYMVRKNLSFGEDTDSEFPIFSLWYKSHFHRVIPRDRSVYYTYSNGSEHFFSTRMPCLDYYSNNGTKEVGFFYCEYPRVARGVYWLLRPLCIASTLLLFVSHLSIVCNKTMRSKVHGWCLAHHAACLFAFNLGQVVYYLTISDLIDLAFRERKVPEDMQTMCTHFALFMYFLLTASWFWLTVLCVNMTLGFKLQVPSSRSGRKKFLFMSAFGWGFPVLLTITCSFMFHPTDNDYLNTEKVPWYKPQLVETRVCFSEKIFRNVVSMKDASPRCRVPLDQRRLPTSHHFHS